MRPLLLLFTITALLLASCTGKKKADPYAEQSPSADFEGFYTYGAKANTFTTCDGDRLWVEAGDMFNELQSIYKVTMGVEDAQLYVELTGMTGPAPEEGPGSDHAGSINVLEIIEARESAATDCQ